MAKKSRRVRRQEAAKPKQILDTPQVEVSLEQAQQLQVSTPALQPAPRKVVNFAQEYLYVYIELRNVFIVALIMFAVMFGLAYFI
jgi:hypothetical protein